MHYNINRRVIEMNHLVGVGYEDEKQLFGQPNIGFGPPVNLESCQAGQCALPPTPVAQEMNKCPSLPK